MTDANDVSAHDRSKLKFVVSSSSIISVMYITDPGIHNAARTNNMSLYTNLFMPHMQLKYMNEK